MFGPGTEANFCANQKKTKKTPGGAYALPHIADERRQEYVLLGRDAPQGPGSEFVILCQSKGNVLPQLGGLVQTEISVLGVNACVANY